MLLANGQMNPYCESKAEWEREVKEKIEQLEQLILKDKK